MARETAEIARQDGYRFARRMNNLSVSAVREILKVTEQPDVISFAGGLPAPELFPTHPMALAYAEVFAESGQAAMQYSTTEGWLPLREWLSNRMKLRQIDRDPNRILITSGSQQGLDLVTRIFVDPGDEIIVENPCYLAALQAFNSYEARLVAVDTDDDGIRIDQLERALQRSKPKFMYIVTDFQNPKGICLSLDRRMQVLELANRYRVPILEDDPYGELRYRGEWVPSLAALDTTGIVIHLGTFSKTLSPGMRIGWVSASDEIIRSLVIAKQGADLHTNTIQQRVVARLLERFEFDEHISMLCKVYGERSATMISSLDRHFPEGSRWTRPDGGLFLWIELPEALTGESLLEEAKHERVAFVPGAAFYAANPKQNFIRLNFSNSKPELIEEGVKRIAGILKRRLA